MNHIFYPKTTKLDGYSFAAADIVLMKAAMLARFRSELPGVLIRKNVNAVSRENAHLLVNREVESADCCNDVIIG